VVKIVFQAGADRESGENRCQEEQSMQPVPLTWRLDNSYADFPLFRMKDLVFERRGRVFRHATNSPK
jgi:hypothetical protein